METANDTAMHINETKTHYSGVTRPESKSDEITKDQEDKLLCGNSDDGDEEDALSEDSLRLRFSDDDAEVDEPSSERAVDEKGDDPQGRNTELGSDVTATKIEKLSNGTCTIENKNITVKPDDPVSNDSFADDFVPNTHDFYCDSENSAYSNGNVKQMEKNCTDEISKNDKNDDEWKFAGHFGEYSRRSSKTVESRQKKSRSNEYTSDSYKNKYYNQNTYYGRGRARGCNSNSKESPIGDETSTKKSSSTDESPQVATMEPVMAQAPDALSRTIKTEDHADDSPNSIEKTANNAESSSGASNETRESINDNEGTNELPNVDDPNAGATPLDGGSSVPLETKQSAVPSHEDSSADLEVDGKSNSEPVNARIESCKVENSGIDESPEKPTEVKNSVFGETESKPAKGLDCGVEDGHEDNKSNVEDVLSHKTNDHPNKLDSSVDSLAKEIPIEQASREHDRPIESNDSSLERAELELAAEILKTDDLTEIHNADDKIDEPEESKSQETVVSVETEPTQESMTVATISEEHCEAVVSKPELENPSIAETKDDETVVKKLGISNDKEFTGETKFADTVEAHLADFPDEKLTSDEDEASDVKITHSTLKRTPTESLDEMELSRRMRVRRKNNESDESTGNENVAESACDNNVEATRQTDENVVVDAVTNCIDDQKGPLTAEPVLMNNTVVDKSIGLTSDKSKIVEPSITDATENIDKIDDCEVIEVPVQKKPKLNRRSWQHGRQQTTTVNSEEDVEEKENVRQKRRTAKTAQEIIRKEFLGNSDTESIDSADTLVTVNYNKSSNTLRPASPPTLKRNYMDDEEKIEPSTIKKLKQDLDTNGDVTTKSETKITDKLQTLTHVRRFFRRDNNGKLAKLKQEELEELLIQKVVETITMRDEIGRLREQAKMSERNQEATRLKCQQLAKQIKDFEMVLNRYQSDRRANPDKNVVPIKINRSVGLQVNFVTDHGIQNLRQLGQIPKPMTPVANGTNSSQRSIEQQSPSGTTAPKRTVKVRSPRRSDVTVTTPTVTPVTTPPRGQQPITPSMAPPPLVALKNVTDNRTPPVVSNIQQTTVPHPIAPKQTILVNGPITNQPIRQATTIQVSKPNNNDLIDLTQEEDKTKNPALTQNTIMSTSITEAPSNVTGVQKIAPRYHTVIQTLPGSVAISAQSGIRVVQPSSQPTPTALVNNMNAPRLTYVMQGGMGPARQVVVTSTPTPIRPAPAVRTSYPLSGTITNGTVRVIPMSTAATIQVYKHPAGLPEPLNPPSNPAWKLPPPAPSLKISKVSNGIVLSWNMALNEKFAEIASYQLFAYQEVSGVQPSPMLWKKVGDVRALPLPMACTLTQFSEGNNYYFAVRAVDKHSRFGFYSQPGNISL